jgi:PAS domain S-box-containing protein
LVLPNYILTAPVLRAYVLPKIAPLPLCMDVTLAIASIALVLSLLQTARSLAQTRLLFETVFDTMDDGVLILDCATHRSRINHAGARLLGYTDSDFSYEQMLKTSELFNANGERLLDDACPSALATRGVFLQNEELTIHRKDTGKIIIVQVNTSAIGSSPHNKPERIMIHYRDITDSRQSDAALRRLAAIVDSSEDAIIGKDLAGIVTIWNYGAQKIFGYAAHEIIGKPITLLIPSDQLQEEKDILTRIRQGETVTNIDTVRQRKDGQLIHVSLTISPIRNSRGVIIGASKIARDITEKRLLQRQLLQSQKMEAIGQLTGGIAHDFNNLLAIIIGNLDLLGTMPGTTEVALHRIEIAQKAASRGADLTRRLLSFASQEQLNPAPTLLEDSIQNMIEMVTRALGPNITITTNLNLSTPPVFVDPAGLETALLNLAVNARDAMPQGGVLALSTHLTYLDQRYIGVQAEEVVPGTYACISVSDTGEGMSKQTLDRVFEPFFTTKAHGKGTGLGLPMVYGFARQSGGSIRIYSEPGCGTTVLLYLPLAESSPEQEVILDRQPIPAQLEQKTVLLVDDEPDLIEIGTAYLTQLGLLVYIAENAAQALEIVSLNHEIDLLITDIVMPGMNGTELARTVRARRPSIRVIYSSGFPANALAERNVDIVDLPLLRKPFRRAEFTALVYDVINAPAAPPFPFFAPRAKKNTSPSTHSLSNRNIPTTQIGRRP